MIDGNKLRGKMVEKNINAESLSKTMGINQTTFYRRLAAGTFNCIDIENIVNALGLSVDEAMSIFFARNLA